MYYAVPEEGNFTPGCFSCTFSDKDVRARTFDNPLPRDMPLADKGLEYITFFFAFLYLGLDEHKRQGAIYIPADRT
jgi:hypothetical protein